MKNSPDPGNQQPELDIEKLAELANMLSESKFNSQAKKRGFVWVGPDLVEQNIKTTWRCKQGHEWLATLRNIKNGGRCPICLRGRGLLTAEDYQALAKAKGLTWLGTQPIYATSKTIWGCLHGHRWLQTYSNIKEGGGCPHCLKAAAYDYAGLAKMRGFIWIGPKPRQRRSGTQWQCPLEHVWKARYDSIERGTSCPRCLKMTGKDYENLAVKHGLIWLGPEVANVYCSTDWRCPTGHVSSVTLYQIVQAGGCPQCVSGK